MMVGTTTSPTPIGGQPVSSTLKAKVDLVLQRGSTTTKRRSATDTMLFSCLTFAASFSEARGKSDAEF